jgi:hypothetical protein
VSKGPNPWFRPKAPREAGSWVWTLRNESMCIRKFPPKMVVSGIAFGKPVNPPYYESFTYPVFEIFKPFFKEIDSAYLFHIFIVNYSLHIVKLSPFIPGKTPFLRILCETGPKMADNMIGIPGIKTTAIPRKNDGKY